MSSSTSYSTSSTTSSSTSSSTSTTITTHSYSLYIEPHYEEISRTYFHIITINKEPIGPLKNYTTRINKKDPSALNSIININNKCVHAIKSINNTNSNKSSLCTPEEITDLYDFLINNDYTISTTLTDLLHTKNLTLQIHNNTPKKILFVISYKN